MIQLQPPLDVGDPAIHRGDPAVHRGEKSTLISPKDAKISKDRQILDVLGANFAPVNERLDRIDTRLDELTTRGGTVERGVASLSSRIAGGG